MDLLGLPRDHRATVGLHTLSWILFGLFSGGVVQQLAFLVRKSGGSPLLVTAVTAGPPAFALFAALYTAALEHLPARLIVAASRGLCAAVFLLAVFLPVPVGLATAGLVALVAGKVADTFYGRLLAGMYPRALRGRLQSVPLFANALALAAASMIAGRLLRHSESSFRWLFPLAASAGVAASLLVTRFPSPAEGAVGPRPPRPRFLAMIGEAAGDRRFLRWTLLYSVATVGYWVVYSALPVFLASVLRFDYWQNGVTLAGFNAAYCLGFLVWGRVLDRLRSVRTMVVSWAIVGLATFVTATGGSYGAVVAAQALAGFALAGNDIAWYPVVLEFAPEHRVDRYMSLWMTAVGARALIAGTVSSILMGTSDTGSRTALLIAAAVMALGSAAMLSLARSSGSPGAGAEGWRRPGSPGRPRKPAR